MDAEDLDAALDEARAAQTISLRPRLHFTKRPRTLPGCSTRTSRDEASARHCSWEYSALVSLAVDDELIRSLWMPAESLVVERRN